MKLAMARSGLPSLFKSPIETDLGLVLVANWASGEYVGVVAPGAVVLSSTLTEAELKLAMARSGLPSPFKSPTETEQGLLPMTIVACGDISKYASTVLLKVTAPLLLVSDGEPTSCTAPA